MSVLRFEWDERKSEANRKKHGVSFDEALSVFADDHALLLADPDHSDDEDRFLLLGLSADFRTLVVCHCYRDEEIIRIISARRATRRERGLYDRRRKP